uniref:Uncharacterized protein n=1 Tax=Tetradesmus obliquus TaxID=3088 RepID=A0A383V7W7_TETOB|eukprot:jgi/Sobl393_1/16611/SZX61675.1
MAAILLLLCAASAAARDIAPGHGDRCSSSASCSTGSTCECTCRSRHGSAAASSSSDVSSAGGGSYLEPGDTCSLRRNPGQAFARCRPGSFCSCSCVASGAPKSSFGSSYLPAGVCADGSKCSSRAPFKCGNTQNLKCSFTATTSTTCAALGYAKPSPSQTYCMANFKTTCADPANAGCNRCAIYKVMQACAAQSSPWPTPSQKGEEACRYHSTAGNYVIVKSRTVDSTQTSQHEKDPETGSNICIMPNHYILMPTTACTGVDDSNSKCTGPTVAYWDGAVRHGYGSSAGDLGFGNSHWAVMINAPDERGQHQMHIHVAPLEPAAASNVLFVAKEDNNMETDLTKPPTHHTVNGHTVAAYFFKDAATPPTSLKTLDVFGTAAAIHNKFSKNPGQEAYGVALIPKKGGYVVAATYGFADVNVMDTKPATNPRNKFCQAACQPFK